MIYKHFVHTFKFVKLFPIKIYQNYFREKSDTDHCYPHWPECVYVSFYEKQWTRLIHPASLQYATWHGIFSEFWTNKAALYPCRKKTVHAEECIISSRDKNPNLLIKLLTVLFAILLCHRTWLPWASGGPLGLQETEFLFAAFKYLYEGITSFTVPNAASSFDRSWQIETDTQECRPGLLLCYSRYAYKWGDGVGKHRILCGLG